MSVLEYLVTSKARRRMLLLLWSERARGSTSELAEKAGVAFASAHTELKAMQSLGLVSSERAGNKEVFFANTEHFDAHTVESVVETAVLPRLTMTKVEGGDTRRRLKTMGAPLRGVEPLALDPLTPPEALLQGAVLSRRDPTVARTMPICVWGGRESLDASALSALSARPEDKHALAFFVHLAGELGGDRRLVGTAETLRDHRIKALRPFFHEAQRREVRQSFAIAEKWGFEMNMDLETFRSLFTKYVSA